MAFTLDNFCRSILAAAATAADSTLQIAKAAAPLRDPPDATEAAPGILVLQDAPSAPAAIEVISYTGRSISGNVVTLTGVTRALEGTTAHAWPAGTPTFMGWTAGILAQKLDVGDTATAAQKLATPRTFSLAGPVTAAGVQFDGSDDLTLQTAIADGALSMAMVSGLAEALAAKLSTSGGSIDGALNVNGERAAFNAGAFVSNINIGANDGNTQIYQDANLGLMVFRAWNNISFFRTSDNTSHQIWTDANFNPSSYMPKSGGAFTGPIQVTSTGALPSNPGAFALHAMGGYGGGLYLDDIGGTKGFGIYVNGSGLIIGIGSNNGGSLSQIAYLDNSGVLHVHDVAADL